METHVKVLAILNIVYGSLGFFGALIIFTLFGGVVSIVEHTAPHAPFAVPILGFIGTAIGSYLIITSAPAIAAGIGLLRFANWGRILGIVMSAVHLLNFPVGTALGIYGLIVLIPEETARLFHHSGGTPPHSGNTTSHSEGPIHL